jgi:putative salt-induced outer membrane protein YdiY
MTTLWALGAVALAEDSTFTGAAAATAEKPETHVTGELGGTSTTGNANFYAVSGLVNASHLWKKNKVSGVAGLNLGGGRAGIDADGDGVFEDTADEYTENSRRLFTDLRYDRFVSDVDAIYVLAGAFHDPFVGYDMRSHEQIGYSRFLVKDDDTELRAELGADLAQENYIEGIDPNYANILAARVLIGITHKFNDKVGFSEVAEVYENVLDPDDVRVLNTAALTSTLSGRFSVKISHSLLFDNVPVEGLKKFDQTSLVTLVATLL